MADEQQSSVDQASSATATQANAQAANAASVASQAAATPNDSAEIERLRKESANYRTQLREAQGELKKFQEANAQAAVDALTKRLADTEGQLLQAQADREQADKRANLARLAAKANVPIEVAEMLDMSKIDLADETKALEQLGRFATRGVTVSPAKPGTWMNTGMTDSELRREIFEGRGTSIFGSK